MFSGGRDSTLAAIRLSQQFDRLLLATITSDHLVGIDSVRRRLTELAPLLPPGSEWLHVLDTHANPAVAPRKGYLGGGKQVGRWLAPETRPVSSGHNAVLRDATEIENLARDPWESDSHSGLAERPLSRENA